LLAVLVQFLCLGCISFGGPAAHIGYFRRVFVEQKAWLSADEFAAKLALCQFLPGPSSSQLGFAIACHRAGPLGGVLAFLGFTLPSFFLMYLFATVGQNLSLFESGAVQGLKLLAVVVVADAIFTMAKQFCSSAATRVLALMSAILLLVQMTPLTQFSLLLLAAVVMAWRAPANSGAYRFQFPFSSAVSGGLFLVLLVASLVFSGHLFSQFYQVGAAVFGGGHVVLPLLETLLSGAVEQDYFLSGYAAAQAVPGPMFSFASFLGAEMWPESSLAGAGLACVAIFLPGFLLLLMIEPSWHVLSQLSKPKAAIAGVNAVAVGMLIAAWINPVLSHAPEGWLATLLAVLGFWALRSGRCPVLVLIASFTGIGQLLW
jgi:chromate transporter